MIVYSNGFRFNVSLLEAGGSINLIGMNDKETPLPSGNYMLEGQRLINVVSRGIIHKIIEKEDLPKHHAELFKKSNYQNEGIKEISLVTGFNNR